MKYEIIDVDRFLSLSNRNLIIDVRSPGEFLSGHIPGAINLPLFSDEERAEVGTIYVRRSKEDAVQRGLEIVGPKMGGFVKKARHLFDGNPILLYCWRGGMRSNSMAWLFQTAGLPVYVLKGGYKAYRHSFTDLLESAPWEFISLNGLTGCGKTDILHCLETQGEQVIDLESLANHKGSAFGHLGNRNQPSTEHFMNLIYERLRIFDAGKPIWIEGESRSIGHVFIPDLFYSKMQSAKRIFYEIPFEDRIIRIKNEYGSFSKDSLRDSFLKIRKRLGGDALSQALSALEDGDMECAIRVAMYYYDKTYRNAFLNTTQRGIS